jgi:hypothetical protein
LARYLSKSSDFNKTVRQPVTALVNGPHGPERVTTVAPIIVQFAQAGLTPYERELAQERFTFGGQAEGEDPLRRVSLFDTESQDWSPELLAEIEAVLDAGQSEWYFRIEELSVPAPWPSYDKQTAMQVLETMVAAGANTELVIAYERENKNRTTLIEQIEALSQEPEPLIAA